MKALTGSQMAAVDVAAAFTPMMARELAIAQKVCVRPILRRVHDRASGVEDVVAIPCGSTREKVCPPCAYKARALRMQQCAEGWHRTDEPEHPADADDDQDHDDQDHDDDQDDEAGGLVPADLGVDERAQLVDRVARAVRSTRHRPDMPDLPRRLVEGRTIGRVFTAPNGRTYRPSMFLTVTMPSYGAVTAAGAPVDPDSYDYRRAGLDALLFSRLLDRFWQNLRRAAGYKVQYFAAVEPQRRLAPHAHVAMRGAIPRELIRQVIAATYVQVWWPACDRATWVHRTPVWDGHDYIDADTGEVLPTWTDALAEAKREGAEPIVVRLGSQSDIAGILADSDKADRAIRYLTKYLTKTMGDAHASADQLAEDVEPDPAVVAHRERLAEEVRWLPCSPSCANWLRYGVQPKSPGPGMRAGRCPRKAHDADHLGVGGRQVLVSRLWSGKTLAEHRTDRAQLVHDTLLSAGVVAPRLERMAASVTLPDGSPRFVWTDSRPDPLAYVRVLLRSIAERQQWRQEYEQAKAVAAQLLDTDDGGGAVAVDGRSANRPP